MKKIDSTDSYNTLANKAAAAAGARHSSSELRNSHMEPAHDHPR